MFKLNIKVDATLDVDDVEARLSEVYRLSALKVVEIAKAKIPKDTGAAMRSIKMRPKSKGSPGYRVDVGVEYAQALEYGTAPHKIEAKNGKALSFEWTKHKGKMLSKKGRKNAGIKAKSAGKVAFASVMHPGTKAQPFFRPAIKQVKNYWIDKFMKDQFPETKGNYGLEATK